MAATIRTATPNDAPQWIELAQSLFGQDYPSKEIYDPAWVACELDPQAGHETWVVELNGIIFCSASILRAPGENANPVLNIGRNLFRSESFSNGAADTLLKKIASLSQERAQMVIVRVPALDNQQQIAWEQQQFVCIGFQPFKHMLQAREGSLFYVKPATPVLGTRLPISESLPQIAELASVVLERLSISTPLVVRDGVTGYPLTSELQFHEAAITDFELWKVQAQSANPPQEVSGSFNLGVGLLRVTTTEPIRATLGQRDSQIVCGLAYYFDAVDRCVRVVDCFATDDISTGAIFQHAVKHVQDALNAVFVEVDILSTAPRLLKSTEQLGFVPVAYFPAFVSRTGQFADSIKLVKLNMAYSHDGGEFTTHARGIVQIVDHNFEDQKVGVAIINLLRALPIFEGLGDGELRKIARLFTQKLYRPKEAIFRKGDSGEEAYIVMRGQVDIQLDEVSKPIASVTSGKIFGELAFLDGAPRNAFAIANQPSILLVVQRAALNELVQREPHLGMVIMRNVAIDLSNKLRNANATIASLKR